MGTLRQNLRVPSIAIVRIHSSQFPENVRLDLFESLRTGEVNHKFHYDSVKQTQKWLALHAAYSPARTDPECAVIYDRSFEAVMKRVKSKRVHVIGLGCGGGQKDTRLLRGLRKKGKEVFYTPSDVSTAMVLVARQAAMKVVENCFPLVCDLATAMDMPEVIGEGAVPRAKRLITFFGMIPNFEPQLILPRLSALVRPEDLLLLSANLAPGADYAEGVKKILPLYDNAVTRDWLMTFLLDLGVERGDGKLDFCVEDVAAGGALGTARPTSTVASCKLKRVAAYFRFKRDREISINKKRFRFGTKKPIRLFFSYRHTPELVRSLLGGHGIDVVEQWIAKSEEEGVFLCRRTSSPN